MVAYNASHAAPMGAATIYRFVTFLSETRQRLRKWNDVRATRNALAKLSDRELKDIGLSRGDLEWFGR